MTCVIRNLASVCLEIVLVSVQDQDIMQHRLRKHFGHTRWYSYVKGSSESSIWSIWRQCQSWCKIDARSAWNVPYAQKLIFTHPIELLDDVCHMESRFSVLRHNISFGARYVHGLRLMHQSLRNHFGSTCWYSQVNLLKWRLGSAFFEIVLILMQDRCTICMEHTICSEINLDTTDGTPR